MKKTFTVTLPDIGEGVVEGEVVEWRKEVGDELKQDEPVVVVMTDKATVELPAPYPGRLMKQYYQPGQVAIKDLPLYDIELLEEIKEEAEEELRPLAASIPEKVAEPKPIEERGLTTKILATPPIRHLAKQMGLDLQEINGTGKDGRIMKEDLHRYSHHPKTKVLAKEEKMALPKLEGDKIQPLIGIRSLMAKKMAESKAKIPHFSYFEQVDVTRLIQMREKFKVEAAKEHLSVTFMPFFIRALSLSLEKYPIVNSSLDVSSNQLIIHKQHNIGVAISTKSGLIVPVLKNVQMMTLPDLIRAYLTLKEKALNEKLTSSDMKDATITISNFGVLGNGGGLWATPIIRFPEAAILATAKIQKLPMVKNDAIAVRDVLNLSWSFDHRIIDGELAAIFSHHFATLLLNPAPLM